MPPPSLRAPPAAPISSEKTVEKAAETREPSLLQSFCPSSWKGDADHYDTQKPYGLPMPKVVQATKANENSLSIGQPIESVPIIDFLHRGIENYNARLIANGLVHTVIPVRSKMEGLMLEGLSKFFRVRNTDFKKAGDAYGELLTAFAERQGLSSPHTISDYVKLIETLFLEVFPASRMEQLFGKDSRFSSEPAAKTWSNKSDWKHSEDQSSWKSGEEQSKWSSEPWKEKSWKSSEWKDKDWQTPTVHHEATTTAAPTVPDNKPFEVLTTALDAITERLLAMEKRDIESAIKASLDDQPVKKKSRQHHRYSSSSSSSHRKSHKRHHRAKSKSPSKRLSRSRRSRSKSRRYSIRNRSPSRSQMKKTKQVSPSHSSQHTGHASSRTPVRKRKSFSRKSDSSNPVSRSRSQSSEQAKKKLPLSTLPDAKKPAKPLDSAKPADSAKPRTSSKPVDSEKKADKYQSRLQISSTDAPAKAAQSTISSPSGSKVMGPITDFLPEHEAPAAFLSLGLRNFTDGAVLKLFEQMSWSRKQRAEFHRAYDILSPLHKNLGEAEISVHMRRCQSALGLWGADISKINRLSAESLTKLLCGCSAMTKP